MEEGPWAKGGRQLWKWKDQATGFPSRKITTLLPALLCYSASHSTPGSTLFLHRTFHTGVSWNPSEEALWVVDWYEKEGNIAICSHMDGRGRHYTKRNQRKTNTVWCHLYVESKKYNKLVNIRRKKQIQTIENKLVVTSRAKEEWRDKIGLGDSEVQITTYKIHNLQGYIV